MTKIPDRRPLPQNGAPLHPRLTYRQWLVGQALTVAGNTSISNEAVFIAKRAVELADAILNELEED